MPVPTQKQLLDELSVRCDALANEVRQLAALSERQLLWQPGTTRWSVAQCLTHVVVADESYFSRISRVLDRAEPDDNAGGYPLRRTLTGRFFLKSFGEQMRMPARAPTAFLPDNDPAAVDRFLVHQSKFQSIIIRTHGFDTGKLRLSSPVTWLIRFRLGECLEFLISHQRRHVNQAIAVTGEPGFPGSNER
jgi:uncharacterized damage-inducible protein DinB